MKNILPPESGKYLGVGVQLAVSFLLGMFIGYQMDKWLGRFPVFTLVGTLGGIALGFYNLFMRLKDRDG